MKIIDADKLHYKQVYIQTEKGLRPALVVFAKEIRKMPEIPRLKVQVDPVKHGQWKRTDAYPHKVYCSECYATLVPNDEWLELYKLSSNYCPNCGAKMDEAKEDAK